MYVKRDRNSRRKLVFLFSAVVFSVMRLLPILQVKAEETMIEESHCASYLTG